MAAPDAVVVVLGAVDALLEEEVQRLRAQVVPAADDFNQHTFEATEEGARRALASAATLPFGRARRWVHLAGAHKLDAASGAQVAAYVARPLAHTVFCLSAPRIDARTHLGRAIKQHTRPRLVGPPSAAALPGWLAAWGQRHAAQMTPRAAGVLVDLVGPEPAALCRTAEVVALFAHPTTPFDEGHVAAVVGGAGPARIFALGDHVGRRQTARAGALVVQLLEEGQPAVLVLSLLVRHLQQLLIARTSEGVGADLAGRLGVPPGVAARLAQEAAGWTPAALADGLGRAMAADVALKSSRAPARVILLALVHDLGRSAGATAAPPRAAPARAPPSGRP